MCVDVLLSMTQVLFLILLHLESRWGMVILLLELSPQRKLLRSLLELEWSTSIRYVTQYPVSFAHTQTCTHTHTQFGGNPVSMAVADAVLRVVESQELQKHSFEMGFYLKEGLEGLMEKHSCIGDVRGQGLFVGVEFVKDRETNEPDAEIAHHLEKQ